MSLSMKRVTRQVLTAHTLREHVEENPIDSPTVSILHSPTIDVEYVFVSSNTITSFKIILINDYHISN